MELLAKLALVAVNALLVIFGFGLLGFITTLDFNAMIALGSVVGMFMFLCIGMLFGFLIDLEETINV